jgi:rSAM/selenodomain-associated transferase 1
MTPDTCICVFVKPPVAGKVKTRLIPTVGAHGAAALAEAFFRDTWDCVESLSWALPVIATTDAIDRDMIPRTEAQVWLQGGGDLDARIERILRRALIKAPFAIALGADSPGIPKEFLNQAHESLRSSDAVLGPCEDGGFYLLGVRQCPVGMLSGIPWSHPTTFARTLDRLNKLRLKSTILDPWYDIDRSEDLDRLRSDVARGAIAAPNTASVLARLQNPEEMESAVSSEGLVPDSRRAKLR